MYISGVVVAFFMAFLMLMNNAKKRSHEGRASGFFDSLLGAAVAATLSWLMVALCIAMLLFKQPSSVD